MGVEHLKDDNIPDLGSRLCEECLGEFSTVADKSSRTPVLLLGWKICLNGSLLPSQLKRLTCDIIARRTTHRVLWQSVYEGGHGDPQNLRV